MLHTAHYTSPLGDMLMAADEVGLAGLWFEGQKYYAHHPDKARVAGETPVLKDTARWLDMYFSGRRPDFTPPLHLAGTDFQLEVWKILLSVPYGESVTYGQIAARLAKSRGLARMSAQAVGGAVGHNRVSVIVPCHRVVGSDGSLTGYAGGIDKKLALLKLERSLRP